MKIMLEIKDNKVDFVMDLLKKYPFVKATPVTPQAKKILKHVQEAVEEMKQIKAGKRKARDVQDLINEL